MNGVRAYQAAIIETKKETPLIKLKNRLLTILPSLKTTAREKLLTKKNNCDEIYEKKAQKVCGKEKRAKTFAKAFALFLVFLRLFDRRNIGVGDFVLHA
jgi:hypothetical protein